MDAYKLTDGQLTALERKPFKLELDIHSLVEPNLDSLI
jgi:hypothetical protein